MTVSTQTYKRQAGGYVGRLSQTSRGCAFTYAKRLGSTALSSNSGPLFLTLPTAFETGRLTSTSSFAGFISERVEPCFSPIIIFATATASG